MNAITRELIIEELEARGYSCYGSDIIKNSVVMPAITILAPSKANPIIYTDKLIENYDNLNDIVDKIISIYESHNEFDFDIISTIRNRNWILEHIFISLQQESDEPLIKKICEGPFTGLEQYLYVRDTTGIEGWSIKLNSSIIAIADISIEEAWDYARRNTFAPDEPILERLSDLLYEMTGCEDFLDNLFAPPLYVLSNRNKSKGSIQILNQEYIKKFVLSLEESSGQRPTKLVILPSSLHEVLLYPVYDGDIFDVEQEHSLTQMVQIINQENVAPEDVLSDHVFILNL